MAMTFIKHFIKEIHTKTGVAANMCLLPIQIWNVNTDYLKKVAVNKKDLLMEGYNYNEC